MKRAVLTAHQLVTTDPPWPYLTWDEGAIIAWLRQQGFDLAAVIWRGDDPASHGVIFEQEE